jgi:hypothetical protein
VGADDGICQRPPVVRFKRPYADQRVQVHRRYDHPVSDVDVRTCTLTGGAVIPGPPGVHSLGASYPLAVLEMSERGVRVRLRFRWMATLVRRVMRLEGTGRGTEMEWAATWEDIHRVLVGPRSIVMFRGSGYPCRFVPSPSRRSPRRSVIANLQAEFLAHQVQVERVRSTISYAIQVGRNAQ